jgi:hypothetical protein
MNPTEQPTESAGAYPTDRRGLLVVLTEPDEGYEELLNRWYDDQHLAERVEIPGILSARMSRSRENRSISRCTSSKPPLSYRESRTSRRSGTRLR